MIQYNIAHTHPRAHASPFNIKLMPVGYGLVCIDPLRSQIKTEKSGMSTRDLKLRIERSWRMHPRNYHDHENYFFQVNLANHENFRLYGIT